MMATHSDQKVEHVLMLHTFSFKGVPGLPQPGDVLDQIKEEFPTTETTVFDTSEGNPVPKDLWAKTTILVTLFNLPEKLEDVPNLHLVHLLSAGSDHVSSHWLIKDPAASHITVTTSSGIHGPPISEWVLMSMLVLTKHYNQLHDWQKEHHWGNKTLWFTSSGDWVGKTVGILGYGSIGRQIARVFSAMGAKIHAYTHSARETPESKRDHGYVIPHTGDPDGTIPVAWFSEANDTLPVFLKSGLHAVILCTPLTPSTTNLITSRELRMLQQSSPYLSDARTKQSPGAIVVNISRGKIIHQADLIDALKDGTIKGAALDVTDPEPLNEDSELWGLPNVVIAPHISGLGIEYLSRSVDVLCVNMRRYQKGQTLINVVDRKRGY